MQTLPPPYRPTPKPRRNDALIGFIVGGLLIAVIGLFWIIHTVRTSGLTAGPDNLFGDQNLKTAVALIELHKVRYGSYPDTLRDLKFTGQWDQMPIGSVMYRVNASHTAYYVEVERGWVGKPTFTMPNEFWQGTGYDPALKP